MLFIPFGQYIVIVTMQHAIRNLPAPAVSVSMVMSVMFPDESPSHILAIWVSSVSELLIVISVAPVSKQIFSSQRITSACEVALPMDVVVQAQVTFMTVTAMTMRSNVAVIKDMPFLEFKNFL